VYGQFDPERFKITILLPRTSELDALKENLKKTDCNFVLLEQGAGVLDFTKALFRVLRTTDIDVVHSNGFTSMVCSVIPAYLYQKPHFLTSHDVFTEKQFQKLKGLIKWVILDRCFRFLDVIHSVSYDAQDNLLEYFPALRNHLSKLVVIPNGIETERFLIDQREDWRKNLALDEQTFLIGFLGRFMAQKGFEFLVEAIDHILKSNINIKPVVLAFGWGGFVREEQAKIEHKGLQAYFYFLPFQENPARAIRGTDVVVIPSLWEACPILPMEVLVAGVPLIGTDCIGLREVLEGTPARIVTAADSKELAEAIIAGIQSPNMEKNERFRSEASKRFDVKCGSEALQKLIKSLIT
jgi:glycosyltransferase involved in cell wall biosynthesis